jgi:hypothetical protein
MNMRDYKDASPGTPWRPSMIGIEFLGHAQIIVTAETAHRLKISGSTIYLINF